MAGWDKAPWMVAGAAHSAETARTLAYASTSGAEGIVERTDLKVQPLAVPGGGVRVAPGGALIRARSAGQSQQTYVGRLPVEDVVQIAPTGSSAGRSDLIVARVEDPSMAGEGWQTPADPTTAQYIWTRVIAGVPAGTKRLQDVPGFETNSAITLARVDLPASTGTVTAAMLTDLRSIATPRRQRSVSQGTISPTTQNLTSGSVINWPSPGLAVTVPEWASQVTARIDLLVGHWAPNTDGDLQLMLGTQLLKAQRFNYDLASGSQRVQVVVAATTTLQGMAGTVQQLQLRGRRTAGSGYLGTVTDAYYTIDLEFTEVPV